MTLSSDENFSGDANLITINNFRTANEFLNFLNQKKNSEVVCLACSGGCDSVFLLEFVCKNFPNLKPKLVVLHFNHNLRGKDSDADECFVYQIAKNKNLEFFSKKLHKIPKTISEEILREKRNEFFEQSLIKFHSRVLLLGHQKNDVAETLLMRLIRASDIAGLSAPKEISIFKKKYLKVRPLLEFSRNEIECFLKKKCISWRDDSSNFDNIFFRNKIRNIILPKLQECVAGVDVIKNLVSAKKNIEEADDAIEFFSQKYLKNLTIKRFIDISNLRHLPRAVLKKIFSEFLVTNELEVRKSFIENFLSCTSLNYPIKFCVGLNKFIEFSGKEFQIVNGGDEQKDWEVNEIAFGKTSLPNGQYLTIDIVPVPENLKKIDIYHQCYVTISESAKISAKQYRSHYKYVPFGHNSERKLGDIISSKTFSKISKKELAVIFVDGIACWVPGLPVSNLFRIKDNTKKALLLTYS